MPIATSTCWLPLQRLADSEARQRQADEALLRGTPSAQLLQVPMWATSLSPDQPQPTGKRLQGTLTIPNNCSVRLMRRVFARAVQVTTAHVRDIVQYLSAASPLSKGR